MRRVVYYTVNGNRTPKFEDAKIVGVRKTELIKINEEKAIPANREKRLENLKKGLTFC